MKIHVLKENLSKIILLASKFASTKAQMPILGYLSIEAGERGIFVTASSLSVSVRLRLAGKIIDPGIAVVPAKTVAELVSSLPLGNIEISTGGEGSLLVEALRVHAKLQTLPSEEFPSFPVVPPLVGEFQLEQFETMYRRIGFSVSTDESRPILTGFLWQGSRGVAAATDGYRLSLDTSAPSWKVGSGGAESLIVPGKAIDQLISAFEETKCELVSFGYSENHQEIVFQGGDVVGVVRTLSGEFPKYETILPGNLSVDCQFSREQMLSAVRSVSIFARDSANIIKLVISGSKLELSANAVQLGENISEVEIQKISGDDGSIAFNSKFLLDFLTHASSERVGFGMTDSLKPGLFYEVGADSYKHVIMPVRVRE